MWLQVENGSIINLDLISRVEMNHRKREATLYEAGIVAASDSVIAYEHFAHSDSVSRANWAPIEPKE